MEQHDFNKIGNIQSALTTLRQYNQYVLFPLAEKAFENPILELYFESPIDDPIETKIEKAFCVAAARAVFHNPNIPEKNKNRSARNTARDLREAMRYAKLEYHSASKGLPHQEYIKRKRALPIVRRAVNIERAKKICKNVAITTLATVIAGPIAGGIVAGTRILYSFLPEKIKEPINRAAKEVKSAAITTIHNSIDYLKSTSVGKKVAEVVEEVKPYFKNVMESAKKIKDKVVDYVKSYWPF